MFSSSMLAFLVLVYSVSAKVYFHEQFQTPFSQRWTYSEDSSVSHGIFETITKTHCDTDDKAIKAVNDSAFYHASAEIDGTLDTTAHDLYFHYETMFEQDIDCGGAYLKLFPEIDPKSLTGNTPYAIMVGPDVCGHGKRMLHLIISHLGKNHLIKDQIDYTVDKYPHLISLHLGTNGKFAIKVDGQSQREGEYKDHFEYLLPKEIDDPKDKKPEDWVDEETIDDPADKKPEDWDERKEIPDSSAKKPDNWDDSTDVEWEPDLIKNPAYKGEWSPKRIPNPAFTGHWKARQIPNPEYKDDGDFGKFSIRRVGFDLWMVRSGTLFGEMFLTDSKDESDKQESKMLERLKSHTDKIKAAEKEEEKKQKEKNKEEAENTPDDEKEDAPETDPEPSASFPESDDETKTLHEDL